MPRLNIRKLALVGMLALLSACASSPAPRTVSVVPEPVAQADSGDVPSVSSMPQVAAGPLGERIDAFLEQPRFAHAEWGIDVVNTSSGEVVYSHQPQKLFVPASNTKLYTAALALYVLGSDARFNTTLYASRPARNGILHGDLILYGRGDPSLGDPALAPESLNWADQFATALKQRGISRVRGDVIGDDTWFQGSAFNSGWEVGDLQTSYATRVSALSNDGNVMTVAVTQSKRSCCTVSVEPTSAAQVVNLTRTDVAANDDSLGIYRPPGSATIYVSGSLPPSVPGRRFALAAPDPALLAAQRLRDALANHGIQVDGRALARHWPASAAHSAHDIVMAQLASPPLTELVKHTLKHSDNLYAQALLLQVGVVSARSKTCTDRENPPHSSEAWGLCAMRALLSRIGLDTDQAFIAEGSGLSRHNLVAPAATTSLLMWVRRQDFAADFLAALPVAGEDGTLAYRMTQGAASHNVRAKTGTLSHVYALSGYATDRAGRDLVFALYLNRYLRPRDALGHSVAPSPQDDLDTVASMIATGSADGSKANSKQAHQVRQLPVP